MANWELPDLEDLYANFVNYFKSRDEDATRMHDTRVTAATNVPDYTKRWNDTTKTFQNWLSSAWSSLVVSIAGGGTGATTAADARTNLAVYSTAQVDAAITASSVLTAAEGESGGVTFTVDDSYYTVASCSLVAGTWLVVGNVNVWLDPASSHRIMTRLLAGVSEYGKNIFQTGTATTGTWYMSIPVMDFITLGSTTTLYMQAKRVGGLATNSAASADYGSWVRAVKIA